MPTQTQLLPRSMPSLSRGLPRSSFGKCTCASFSTTASSKATLRKASVTTSSKFPSSPLFRRSSPLSSINVRLASTGAAAPNADARPASSSSQSADQPDVLTWNRFLALRRTRRRISLAASVICAVGTTTAGMSFLSTADWDKLQQFMFGLDPIVVLGLSTAGSGLVGWLIGPFFGNGIFRLYYRRLSAQIAGKEKEFYIRIKKYRVDPSSSSIANPVPDFYGEKIGSVKDYRRWLKDQRAFNLKRGRML